MKQVIHNSRKPAKKISVSNSEPLVTDFGTRAIYRQNFSLAVSVPKLALANIGINGAARVNFQLVQQNGEKFL